MMTVGDVDYARQRVRSLGDADRVGHRDGVDRSGRADGADLRGRGGRQGDRDRAGRVLPGLDLQRPGARVRRSAPRKAIGCGSSSELRLASALDAFSRHPRGADGRRAGGRADRPGRGVRLRVRCKAVRLPPLSLPRAAAAPAHAQGHVRRLRHRSRSGAPSRGRRRRGGAAARHAARMRAGRRW